MLNVGHSAAKAPRPDLDGIARSVETLANELRADRHAIRQEIQTDRAETGKQISALTAAIREQAAHQKSFHESLQQQWAHIDKARESQTEVRSEVAELAHSRVWSKQTREAIIQIVYLIIAVAGLLAGPVATYVAVTISGAVAPMAERIAKNEACLAEIKLQQEWTLRAMRVQAQVSAQGATVDWGEIPALD